MRLCSTLPLALFLPRFLPRLLPWLLACVLAWTCALTPVGQAYADESGVPMQVIDPDPDGTNVREKPDGRIIKVIPYGGKTTDALSKRRVMVIGQDKAWFQVRLDDGTIGWMHRSVLGPLADAAKDAVAPQAPGRENTAPAGPTAEDFAKVLAEELEAATQKSAAAPKPAAPKQATPKAAPPKTVTPKAAAPKAAAEKSGTKTGTGVVTGADLAATVKKQIGVTYLWGGATRKGFDCSGLMYYVYRQHNITIPRTSREQAKAGKPVAKKNLKPGDLVFFAPTSSSTIDHVGMYIGDDTIVHAPNPTLPVIETRLSDYSFMKGKYRSYFQGVYVTGRRILP